MAAAGEGRDAFAARRRREQVAFLVVKFLRASVLFRAIDREFDEYARAACLAGCGLFEKVRDLVDGLQFDLKEKAHALFRAAHAGRGGAATAANGETHALDSLIGTAYHFMLMLQESLYQIERYGAEAAGRARPGQEVRGSGDTPEELAARVLARCRALYAGTEDTIRRFVAAEADNEILVLNLVQNRDLLAAVYGEKAAEDIYGLLCPGWGPPGTGGWERAVSFARARCGNVTGLPAPASAS